MAKYPNYVMEAVRQNMGIEKDDTSHDKVINEALSRDEVFDRFWAWHGIFGYKNLMKNSVDDIFYGGKKK